VFVSTKSNRVAFVLSGGGSLGAIQVGMLRALYERGIAPDLIVGTSAGATSVRPARQPTLTPRQTQSSTRRIYPVPEGG
jgi:NTE family protein